MPSPTKNPNNSAQRLRIIAGQWRGRLLPVPIAEGLRPTGNRIRETLFNWLQTRIPDSHCLDLFAGTGALGLEALSRGAAYCTLVELNAKVCQQLQANVNLLRAQNCDVVCADALRYLQQPPDRPFDVVFLDPPFAANLWQSVAEQLATRGWLHADSVVYVETPAGLHWTMPESWRSFRQKKSGQVNYSLYHSQTDAAASR